MDTVDERVPMTDRRGRASWVLTAKLMAFVGLSALLTTVVVASVLNLNVQASTSYQALFSNVTGLQAGESVRIAGVEVGRVSGVRLLSGPGASRCGLASPQSNCALVSFDVDSRQRLTTTTKAGVFFASLLGQRFLGLMASRPGGRPLHAGDTIGMAMTQPGLDLTAVFNGFQPLFNALTPAQVNQLTGSIIQVFQGQSGTVADLVAQTAAITTNLAGRQQILNEVLGNLAGLLDAVNGQGTQLGKLIDNFSTLVSGLAGQRAQIASTIDGFATLSTTVAGLLQQSQPALNENIAGLASATATLSTDQSSLDGVLRGLPRLLNTLSKFTSTGSYINVYVCNLTLDVTGALNISLIPGVTAPQYPANVRLPSGPVGDQTQHTANCA